MLGLSWLGSACTLGGVAEPTPLAAPIGPAPADNPFSVAKFELGRHLFYDPRLSLNGDVACASCHQQSLAFTDGQATSLGTTGQHTHRNAQSLVNAAYATTLTFANFVLTELEAQAYVPLFSEDPIEMGMAGRDALLVGRLLDAPRYPALFAAAFPEVDEPITIANLVRALASFQRGLVSARAPYDAYLAGDLDALTAQALQGLALFESRELGCTTCHGGRLFSSAFAWPELETAAPIYVNNGLHERYPVGNRGLQELTGQATDEGRFRPPSLRNVAVTAPYMHDGSLATLEDVIDHYNRGGAPHPQQHATIRPLALSATERAALLAFLRSLTDTALLNDPRFSDPWQMLSP